MSAVDTTGWSAEWRRRLHRATPGLSVPVDTPRGESERAFLALFDGHESRTFRSLCEQVGEPPDPSWASVERWVRELLMDLKRVGSVAYDKRTRRWSRA